MMKQTGVTKQQQQNKVKKHNLIAMDILHQEEAEIPATGTKIADIGNNENEDEEEDKEEKQDQVGSSSFDKNYYGGNRLN